MCGYLRSFGRSHPLADAALCVVAYVRPANIDDDALLTHRYRTTDVKADSRNLNQSILPIIIDSVLLEFSFNCSKKMRSTMELRVWPLLSHIEPKSGTTAMFNFRLHPQSEPLNARGVPEPLCSCKKVGTLGPGSDISKREMYLINSNILEMCKNGLSRGHPLLIEKVCAQ